MKIGIVLPDVPTYSETFFRNKIKGLHQEGYEVTIFTQYTTNCNTEYHYVKGPRKSQFKVIQAIKTLGILMQLGVFHIKSLSTYIRLEKASKRSVGAIVKSAYFSSHILSKKLDWLHFGFATMTLDKENIAKAIGAKMSLSVRGYDISTYPVKYPSCYQLLWDKVDKIHVISDDLYKRLFEHGFNNECPVEKITPAIDVTSFYKKREPQTTSCLKVLSVGRLHWKKGFDYALKSFYLLQQSNIDFSYTIVGGGDELEHLKYMAHTLGIDDKVHFKGILSPQEVINELHETEVYLQPSVQEGFCNAVLEAQAAGCLCLVSDAEGLPENVLNNKTGWVFHRRNVEEIKEKLNLILNLNPEEKGKIIENAQDRVKSEFNLSKQRSLFVDFFKN